MKLHPRTMMVQRAHLKLAEALIAIVRADDLTPGEVVAILTDEMGRWIKYVLRIERHGTTDKKADEA